MPDPSPPTASHTPVSGAPAQQGGPKGLAAFTWPHLRRGLLELVISPAALMLLAAIAWTVAAKAQHGFSLDVIAGPAELLRVTAPDLLVFSLMGACLALLRARNGWLRIATFCVALAALALAGLNATYLRIAGEQGTWYDIVDAYKRRKELRDIVEDMSSWSTWSLAVLALAGALAAAAALRWWSLRRLGHKQIGATLAATDPALRRHARERLGRVRAGARARAWLVVALFGGLISMLPKPPTVQGRALTKNIVWLVLKTSAAGRFEAKFEGWSTQPLVEPAALEAWAATADRPNVLIVVLESTRWDHTSLAGDQAQASTPTLARFAKSGFVATSMRSVLPHTTKSMFSMVCGQLPTMQKGIIEVAANRPPQCLPALLASAGYDTYFSQSAFGTFEQRPRLVENFGFESFEAFESIRGQKLGYLASDDASMVAPFNAWLEAVPRGQPWLAMLLTSATHHTYKLPSGVTRHARRKSLPMSTDKERYARLVEAEDRMLQQLHSSLAKSGELRNTIVVVVGDHGEGFGEQGVKQHDNNYFEEGLHVPFVIFGPGIEAGVQEADANMLDFTPTLMAALGLPAPSLPGHDLRAADYPRDSPRWFGCYDPSRCRGFVQGGRKYVFVPRDDEAFWFDLNSDPNEERPQVVDASFSQARKALDAAIGQHRVYSYRSELPEQRRYGLWWCKKGKKCRHPAAWKRRDRYDAETGEDLKAESAKQRKSRLKQERATKKGEAGKGKGQAPARKAVLAEPKPEPKPKPKPKPVPDPDPGP